jgi:hypothetical protein
LVGCDESCPTHFIKFSKKISGNCPPKNSEIRNQILALVAKKFEPRKASKKVSENLPEKNPNPKSNFQFFWKKIAASRSWAWRNAIVQVGLIAHTLSGILQPNHRRRGGTAHRHAPPPPSANFVQEPKAILRRQHRPECGDLIVVAMSADEGEAGVRLDRSEWPNLTHKRTFVRRRRSPLHADKAWHCD